ncbi:MAG: hypothetical protein NTU62_17365, partial [Spirochaetes bacterium]|nr:hypothetical protein [Spirochaetota bacterium]
ATAPKADAPTLAATARAAVSDGQRTGTERETRAVTGRETRTITVRIVLRASAAADLAGLRLSFAFPGWTPVPATTDVGALAAGGERTLEVELALGDVPEVLPAVLPGAAWMRWERGTEGRSAAVLLDVTVEGTGPEGALR